MTIIDRNESIIENRAPVENGPDSPIPEYSNHIYAKCEGGSVEDKSYKAFSAQADMEQAPKRSTKPTAVDATKGIPASASWFLRQAVDEMRSREDMYDAPDGERSMEAATKMFNVLTDAGITERQGWMFMSILKMVRAEYNGYREDDYVDGAAYFALGGEAASKE
jgi:hypothetical protein